MLVKDLKPRMNVPEIVLELVSKGEVRPFATARAEGKVCSVAAKDEEGKEVSLTLWNEQCLQYNDGDKVKLTNAWTSEFQGSIQISTGKQGTIEKI
jgi:ssDNA-binding replication factor A large subunit